MRSWLKAAEAHVNYLVAEANHTVRPVHTACDPFMAIVRLVEGREYPDGYCDFFYDMRGVLHAQIVLDSPPSSSYAHYIIALHELGHAYTETAILNTHKEDVVVLEEAAWRWAKTHALVWDDEAEQILAYGLGSYYAKGAEGQLAAKLWSERQER